MGNSNVQYIEKNNGPCLVKVEQSLMSDFHDILLSGMALLSGAVEQAQQECTDRCGRCPVDHWKSRIKSDKSISEKLRRLHFPVSAESAVQNLHDVVGIRLICTYVDDVYHLRDALLRHPRIQQVETKDYIRHPKGNGYRSLHLIVGLELQEMVLPAEVQIRTLAMDCWAALEHQLRYKSGREAPQLMIDELKRCADEMASTDWNLLSIREMLKDDYSTEFSSGKGAAI